MDTATYRIGTGDNTDYNITWTTYRSFTSAGNYTTKYGKYFMLTSTSPSIYCTFQ